MCKDHQSLTTIISDQKALKKQETELITGNKKKRQGISDTESVHKNDQYTGKHNTPNVCSGHKKPAHCTFSTILRCWGVLLRGDIRTLRQGWHLYVLSGRGITYRRPVIQELSSTITLMA